MKNNQGFTLIELMIVVVIIAILAAIAYPSYRNYMERKDLDLAKQVSSDIAKELEQWKMRNFTYKGFKVYSGVENDKTVGTTAKSAKKINDTTVEVPAENPKYQIVVSDFGTGGNLTANDAKGMSYIVTATRVDSAAQANNYDLAITSTGLQCKGKESFAGKKSADLKSCTDTW